MKRNLLLSILCIGTLSLSAQSQFFNLKNWQLAKISVHAGMDKDMLGDLHQNYFLSTTRQQPEVDYSNLEFGDRDVYSMICENPNIRLEAVLTSPTFKNVEWRFGMNAIFNRIDAISYYNYDNVLGNSEYLSFNNVTNELSLETGILKVFPITRKLAISGGAGTNIGFTFANSLDIYGSTVDYTASQLNYTNVGEVSETVNNPSYTYYSDYLDLKNGINQRAYLQAGLNYELMSWLELGFDARYGIGYRGVIGAPMAMTRLQAFSFSAKYKLSAPKALKFLK